MLDWLLIRISRRYRETVKANHDLTRENRMLAKMVGSEMGDSCRHRERLLSMVDLLINKEEKIPECNYSKFDGMINQMVTAHTRRLKNDVRRKEVFAKRYIDNGEA